MAIPDQITALLNIQQAMGKIASAFERSTVAAGLHRQDDPQAFVHNLVGSHFFLHAVLPEFLQHPAVGGGGAAGAAYGGTPAGRGGGVFTPSGRRLAGPGGLDESVSAEADATFSANYFTQKLLRHGNVDPTLISKLNASLRGQSDLSDDEYEELRRQAGRDSHRRRVMGDKAGFADDFHPGDFRNLDRLRHNAQERKQAAETADAMAERERTRELREGTRTLRDYHGLLNDVAGASAGVFRKGALATMTAAQAAPDAYATLVGSFQLLAASVGQGLVRPMAEASMWLQGLAHKFHGLSQAQKEAYVQTGLWTLGIAAAVAALPRLVALVADLQKLGAGAGLRGAGGLALAHPLVTGAVVATAGGALAAATAARAREESERRRFQPHGLSREGYEGTPEFQRYKEAFALDPIGARRQLQKDIRAALGSAQDAAAAANRARGLADNGGSSFFQAPVRYWNEFLRYNVRTGSSPVTRADDAFRAAQQRVQLLQDLFKEFEGVPTTLPRSAGAGLGAAGAAVARARLAGGRLTERYTEPPESRAAKLDALQAAQGLLADITSRNQPAYYGVEDLHKAVQLNALQDSPLQEEIRRLQRESLETLLQILEQAKTISAQKREELEQEARIHRPPGR